SDFAKDATGSNPALIAESLVNTFRYGNAVLAMPDPSDDKWKDSALEKALNANLDAHKPVGLGIFKSDVADGDPGHGVVADGYGYSGGKICYHINMGWGGDGDVWYDLPGILEYDLIKSVIYNIYSRSAGEIISGKLATSSDVTVTMASTSVGSKGAYVSIEGVGFSSSVWIGNDDGNFVFVGVPSDTEFTITAKLAGHSFPRKTVRTGRSGATATSVGNVWGVIIKEPLYSGESPFGGGGCDAAALPALFAAVGAGVVLFVRKKR
ncbi:MAG: C10 family peptidase, partial [Synergistaceae bacterium]|nr:C10 family peptidase [Synergistaceae bacterium]